MRQVIQQKGHGHAVDWWCLGIFVHELLECYARGLPEHGVHALTGEAGKGVDLVEPNPAAAVVVPTTSRGATWK